MAFVLGPEIDEASASAIIQLQLEDAELYFASSKGKSREPTSEEQAFRMQDEELKAVSQMLLDRRMAESVAAAVQADGQILANSIAVEETPPNDGNIARRWTEDEFPAGEMTDQSRLDLSELDYETLEKLQVYVSNLLISIATSSVETFSEERETGESSAWAAQRAPRQRSPTHRCIACREETEFINVVRVPCQHEYCRSCLEELFTASMTDETLFPPRCCGQSIAMNIAQIFLNSDLIQQYEQKKVEFETPNRTYCYNPQCSSFIPMVYIEDEIAPCFECGCTTCTICKARSHTGDCPNDTATQQLLAITQTNGWKRCRSCKRMIELDHGCNHMMLVLPISPRSFSHQLSKLMLTNIYNSCRCGAEFCYECGALWKTCLCDQWNEGRLVARDHQIVDREQNLPVVANPPPVLNDAWEAAVDVVVPPVVDEAAPLAAVPRAITPDVDDAAVLDATPRAMTPDVDEDGTLAAMLRAMRQDIDQAAMLAAMLRAMAPNINEAAPLAAMSRATTPNIDEVAVLAATPRAKTPDIDEDTFCTPPTTPSTIRDLDTDATITQSAIDGRVPDNDELSAPTEVPEPAHHEQTQRDPFVARPRKHYYRCFHKRWTNVNDSCKKCFISFPPKNSEY